MVKREKRAIASREVLASQECSGPRGSLSWTPELKLLRNDAFNAGRIRPVRVKIVRGHFSSTVTFSILPVNVNGSL